MLFVVVLFVLTCHSGGTHHSSHGDLKYELAHLTFQIFLVPVPFHSFFFLIEGKKGEKNRSDVFLFHVFN